MWGNHQSWVMMMMMLVLVVYTGRLGDSMDACLVLLHLLDVPVGCIMLC